MIRRIRITIIAMSNAPINCTLRVSVKKMLKNTVHMLRVVNMRSIFVYNFNQVAPTQLMIFIPVKIYSETSRVRYRGEPNQVDGVRFQYSLR